MTALVNWDTAPAVLAMSATTAAGAAGFAVGRSTAWAFLHATPWRTAALAPVTAILWGGVVVFGGGTAALVFTWFCSCAIATDVASRRLPNVLTAAGAVGVLGYATAVGEFGAALVGACALFGCYLLVHLCLPRAFGAGDVKLAFALGGVAAVVGTDAWVGAALLAPLSTGVVGLTYLARGRSGATVPHGPSMCAATLLTLILAAP